MMYPAVQRDLHLDEIQHNHAMTMSLLWQPFTLELQTGGSPYMTKEGFGMFMYKTWCGHFYVIVQC